MNWSKSEVENYELTSDNYTRKARSSAPTTPVEINVVTSTLESLDDDHDDEEDTNGCFAFIKRKWQKFTEPKTVSEDDMDSLELYYLSFPITI